MKFTRACLMILMLLSVVPFAEACQVSVLPVGFGAFDNLNNPVDANGQVTVTCTILTPVTIHLDAGSHSNGLFLSRKMANTAGQTLNYNLYLDSARVLVWGDGTGGTQVVTGTTGGVAALPLHVPVYGRIASGQLGSVGTYSDSIIVTVIW